MTSHLKVLLSAVAVAGLLASPTMAKTRTHTTAARALANVPADAHAAVGTYYTPGYASGTPAQRVYSADVRVPAGASELNPDFQLSGRGVSE